MLALTKIISAIRGYAKSIWVEFRPTALIWIMIGCLVVSAGSARCGEAGFDVSKNDWSSLKENQKPDPNLDDGIRGVTASDFYKLLDNSIGDKFGGLIMVFGGCFTEDFSNKVPAKLAKKPVAILAATNKTQNFQYSCSIDGKNPFLDSLLESWQHIDEMSGKEQNPTAEEVFKLAKGKEEQEVERYNEKTVMPREGQKVEGKVVTKMPAPEPSFTAFPRDDKDPAGAKLTLQGKGLGKKYAIIFMGKPETYYDWNFFVAQYKQLKDAGYEVEAMFGTGKRQDDGTAFLTNHESGAPGETVNEEAKKHGHIHDVRDSNFRYSAATFRKLRAALTKWKLAASEDKDGKNQYIFIVGTHSTNMARDRDADNLKIELPPDDKAGGSRGNTAVGGERNKRPKMAEPTKKSVARNQPARSNDVGITPGQAELLNTAIGVGMGFAVGRGGGGSHNEFNRSAQSESAKTSSTGTMAKTNSAGAMGKSTSTAPRGGSSGSATMNTTIGAPTITFGGH